MQVSGAGSAHTPPRHTAAPQRPTSNNRTTPDRSDDDALTSEDRALIAHVTGHPVTRGRYDAFAASLAADRAAGRLLPDQQVTALYLKDLERRHHQTGHGANPITPHLERALSYLSRTGARRIDLTA